MKIHELAWNKTGLERHSITEGLDLHRVNEKKQLGQDASITITQEDSSMLHAFEGRGTEKK